MDLRPNTRNLSIFLPGMIFFIIASYISLTSYSIGGMGVETDFYWDYAPAADMISQGKLPMEHLQFRGPGYPVVLAALNWFGDTFQTAKIVSLISSAVVLILFNYLLITRFGIVYGLVGALTLALNGVFLEYSIRVGTDMFFLMLQMLAITFITIEKRPGSALLSGFISGWAFITRYNGAALLAMIFIWSILLIIEKKEGFRKIIAFAWIGVMIPVLPWSIISVTNYDPAAPSNISNILYGIKAEGKVPWDTYWYGVKAINETDPTLGTDIIKDIAVKAIKNTYGHFSNDINRLTGLALSLLAFSGLILLIVRQNKAGIWRWGLIAGLFNYIILLVVFYSPRFSLGLIPIYIVLALVFFEWIERRLSPFSRRTSWFVTISMVILLLGVTSPRSWSRAVHRISSCPAYLLGISEQSELQGLPTGTIAARKPHLPYLLSMPFEVLPILNNTSEMLDWMETKKIRYLFLTSGSLRFRPSFSPLLGSEKANPRLRQIYFQDSNPQLGFWELINYNDLIN